MVCPYCNSKNIKVVDSRPDGKREMGMNSVYRMRKCFECGSKFQTVEVLWEHGRPPDSIIYLSTSEDEKNEYILWLRKKRRVNEA